MNLNPALALEDVTLVHGDGEETVTALDHVTLRVEPGEFVAIVGPSGAGKSSLLAVAGALTPPTQGSVRLDGIDLSVASPAKRDSIRRNKIGFVFQSGNLIPALTALDQVRLPLTFGSRRAPRRSPSQLLTEVGMEHKSRRRPHQLSGGERQRVGIARALVNEPRVLLVDEPTAALDRRRSQEIVGLLARESRQYDVAAIMVTHDHDVLAHCDRVYEMVDGRLTLAAG